MDTQPSLAPPIPSSWKKGCDISQYSEQSGKMLSLDALKSFDFVVMRATAAMVMDTRFIDHLYYLANANVCLGTYHAFFCNRDPVEQGEYYAQAISSSAIDFDPALDFELLHGMDPCEAIKKAYACIKTVEDSTGKRCEFYSYDYFIRMLISEIEKSSDLDAHNALVAIAQRPLWIAHYQNSKGLPAQPPIPAPFTDWKIWQYRGDVAAANGIIDLNYMKEGTSP